VLRQQGKRDEEEMRRSIRGGGGDPPRLGSLETEEWRQRK
jgi:hypothetical protein